MIFTMAVPACVLLIQSGLVGGDPLKEFFSEVLVKAGQQVVLPCQSNTKESDINLNFFWYRQFLGDTLTFLLQAHKTTGAGKYRSGRFSMVVYKNNTAPLEIAGVSVQDTAIYYCALRLHLELRQISVRLWAQPRLQEAGGGQRAPGDSVTLSCRGSGFIFRNSDIYWYRQFPGGMPEWVSFIHYSGHVKRLHFPQATTKQFVSFSKHGDSTRGLDNLHWCLVMLTL
ncbi:uncharacterized protein LOC102042769 [Geospiza fortis]|uniref:Uncharacterized protein LOC102042769 n=1 Tax=Geospiza fortis TaxID=48883 RepID=A0A8N5I5E6_GEOFO|nr:uncharacterized protein LOC102042769 [Geospiza fortis]